MRTGSFFLLYILFTTAVPAQKHRDTVPAYQKAHIPAFRMILLPDSSVFTNEQIEKGKQTIIMIFSPDCEHCVNSIKDLLAHMDLFPKVQFVMATPLSFTLTKKFYNEFGFGAYTNIKMGTLNDFFLGQYFNMHTYPGIFLFNKKGKFKAEFKPEIPWERIAKEL